MRIKRFNAVAAKRINVHGQPFVAARNLIFSHLEKAVGGDDTNLTESAIREFLGYAPVLETIAVLLARETNYADFITNLEQRLDPVSLISVDRPLAVLHHITNRLLEREQEEKLVKNIRPALEAVAAESGWDSWMSLYSPNEQRSRLLGRILKREVNAAPVMPAPLRAKYEERLETWLPE